jgi:glucokinase
VLTIGVDVGGTKLLGVAVDPAAPEVVLASHRVPTPEGGAGLAEAVASLVELLDQEVGAPSAVGIGVPGLVDRAGVLHVGPHLHHLADVSLVDLVGPRVGLPVVVDNDANCHAFAELRAGAARGRQEVLVVTFGTGIGAGVITSGRLVHGAHGFAGEPGHMVVDRNGPPCPCGGRGCWERFASGSGLGRLARDAALGGRLAAAMELAGGDPEAVRGEHVTATARQGDDESLVLIEDLARWMALGLANLVNVLDPAVIVMGGGLVEAADLLLPPVRAHLADYVMASERRPLLEVVPAELGERAGAIGAALLAAGAVG